MIWLILWHYCVCIWIVLFVGSSSGKSLSKAQDEKHAISTRSLHLVKSRSKPGLWESQTIIRMPLPLHSNSFISLPPSLILDIFISQPAHACVTLRMLRKSCSTWESMVWKSRGTRESHNEFSPRVKMLRQGWDGWISNQGPLDKCVYRHFFFCTLI